MHFLRFFLTFYLLSRCTGIQSNWKPGQPINTKDEFWAAAGEQNKRLIREAKLRDEKPVTRKPKCDEEHINIFTHDCDHLVSETVYQNPFLFDTYG